MIVGGVVLLLLTALFPALGVPLGGQVDHVLYVLGVLLIIAGLILTLLGFAGRPIGGRRTWY